MNVGKLEAFLKEHGLKNDGQEIDFDYNGFKCGYCTAEVEEESQKIQHPDWDRHWVSPEEEALAMANNQVWLVNKRSGHNADKYEAGRAYNAHATFLKVFSAEADQDMIDQLAHIQKLFDKHCIGEFSHAYMSFTTGQWYGMRAKDVDPTVKKNKNDLVYQKTSVKEHLEEQAADWVSDESRDKAYEQGLAWNFHWYPRTPISFYSVYAATLQELVDYLENEKPEQV